MFDDYIAFITFAVGTIRTIKYLPPPLPGHVVYGTAPNAVEQFWKIFFQRIYCP